MVNADARVLSVRRRQIPSSPTAIRVAGTLSIETTPVSSSTRSNRLEVLDQIALFLAGQVEAEVAVVVLDDVGESGEPAVMVKSALVDFFHVPQRPQRRRAVAFVRSSHRLEIVDTDLVRRMQVPAGFSEER